MVKVVARRAVAWLQRRVRTLGQWTSREKLATLHEERRRFLALLDAVDVMVVLTSSDRRVRFANRRAAAMIAGLTGRPTDAIVGVHLTELGLPEELSRHVAAAHARVEATLAPVTNEVAVPQPGGGWRWFEEKISPVSSDGALVAYVLIGSDIDDRKRAQRRLELLSKVSALAGNLDLDELLPAIARLSIPELADWSAVDVAGEGGLRRIFVAARDPARAAVAEELQRFQPWSQRAGWTEIAAGRPLFFPDATDEVLRANAQNDEHLALMRQLGLRSVMAVPLWLRGRAVAVMGFATAESGRRYTREDLALAEELAHRAAVVIDRAQLHAELKASEARFRVALAAGNTAVFEQDRELRYRWHFNWAMGISAIGKTHADIFLPAEAAQLDAIKGRVLDTGEPAHEEVRLTIRGEEYAVALAIDPVRNAAGAITGIIGSGTDITRERRAQDELAKAVTFREQLMGILGHDLRTPLGAVVGAATLLQRRTDLPAAAREHVSRIDRAARRMTEMIRTLLDLTQLRFVGSLPMRLAPTDLAAVARAIVDELRAATPDHAIELEVHGDARGRWDAARLGELLSNLVGNALVHGADGEPVRVVIDDDGDDVRLRVHNGGPAIAPEVRAGLFQPFAHGARRDGVRNARGLGLGLYIVHQIVRAHGGAVAVESTDGDGTTFSVRLPRAVAERTAAAAP